MLLQGLSKRAAPCSVIARLERYFSANTFRETGLIMQQHSQLCKWIRLVPNCGQSRESDVFSNKSYHPRILPWLKQESHTGISSFVQLSHRGCTVQTVLNICITSWQQHPMNKSKQSTSTRTFKHWSFESLPPRINQLGNLVQVETASTSTVL